MERLKHTIDITLFFERKLALTKYRRFLVCWLLIFFCHSTSTIADENDYYKALEAEADTIHIDSMNSNKPSVADNARAQSWLEQYKLTQEQVNTFEKTLSSRLPQSFNSYQHLSDDKKAAVIHAYIDNSNSLMTAIQRLYKFKFKHNKKK